MRRRQCTNKMKQPPGTSRKITKVMLWCGVVALSIIGVAAVIARGIHVARTLATDNQNELSALAERNVQQVAAALNIKRGTKLYQQLETTQAFFDGKYATHPLLALLHIVPGGLLLILAPLQFSTRIRTHHIRFHRWSGRVLLIAVAAASLSAFFLGLLQPFGGATESLATVVFGGFFLFAGTRAFISIRRHDVAHHREWMIRMFSIALGVSIIRIVEPVLVSLTGTGPQEWFGPSLWIGWLFALAVAELWIKRTRDRYAPFRNSVSPGIPDAAS